MGVGGGRGRVAAVAAGWGRGEVLGGSGRLGGERGEWRGVDRGQRRHRGPLAAVLLQQTCAAVIIPRTGDRNTSLVLVLDVLVFTLDQTWG